MADTRLRFTRDTPDDIDGVIVDDDGNAVPGSALTQADVTLYNLDRWSGWGVSPLTGVINGHYREDFLGSLLLPVSDVGAFTWHLAAADNPVDDVRRQIERHMVVFEFAWAVGSPAVFGATRVRVEIDVVNV